MNELKHAWQRHPSLQGGDRPRVHDAERHGAVIVFKQAMPVIAAGDLETHNATGHLTALETP